MWTVGSSILLLLTVGAAAQTPSGPSPLELNCSPRHVDTDRALPTSEYWLNRYPKTVTAAVAPLEAEGRWEDAVDYIVELFEGDFETWTAQGFYSEAERYRDAVKANLAAARMDGVAGSAAFDVQEDPRDGPARFLAFNQTLALTADDDSARQRSVCWLSHSLRRFDDRLNEPGRLSSELELRARVERWNVFNDRGLTPYPWELVLNEAVSWLRSRPALEPPKLQLIVLRPSVAVEVDSKLGNRINVAAVEVLGLIGYVNNRTWYLGASFLWTSPTEASTGLGATVHVAPWLKGGPVWRDVDGDGSRDLRWTLSLDAFDLFKGAPQSLLEAARVATAGRAGG